MTRRLVLLAGFLLSILVPGCAREAPPAEAPRAAATTPAPAAPTAQVAVIAPAAVRDMLASKPAPVLLDVRSPVEYAAGHIPGALNIPYEDVVARRDEIPAEGPIVVFCAVGPRARVAEESLVAAGMDASRLLHMDGGMVAWDAAGLPSER